MAGTTIITSEVLLVKHSDDTVIVTFNMTEWLGTTDLIDTVTNVLELDTSDLTITDIDKNDTDIEIDGRTIETGKGIEATVSGGTAGLTYRLKTKFVTVAGKTLNFIGNLLVSDQ
jgi:hypothetical protein